MFTRNVAHGHWSARTASACARPERASAPIEPPMKIAASSWRSTCGRALYARWGAAATGAPDPRSLRVLGSRSTTCPHLRSSDGDVEAISGRWGRGYGAGLIAARRSIAPPAVGIAGSVNGTRRAQAARRSARGAGSRPDRPRPMGSPENDRTAGSSRREAPVDGVGLLATVLLVAGLVAFALSRLDLHRIGHALITATPGWIALALVLMALLAGAALGLLARDAARGAARDADRAGCRSCARR